MIKTLDLQDYIFESNPGRMSLLSYKSESLGKTYKVSIYRNHSFELIEHTISPFLDYAQISIKFSYSDYDDSLSFLNIDTESNLLVLWLDLGRYETADVSQFLNERLTFLQTVYKNPILLVPFEGNVSLKSDKLVIYNLDPLKEKLDSKYIDERLEAFSGTRMSSQACLYLSKDLGLNYFPALLKPNLKCIVVDLDNTLYKGVLGEDGVEGVILTEGHKQLQLKLKALAAQGFFLCVASKNDQNDVENLFKQRQDFPLNLENFVKIYANWDGKSDSIQKCVDFLNINVDSILFIDDNLGEIVSVLEQHPLIHVIHAKDNAYITCEVLSNFPGMLRLVASKEDALRKGDALANEQRQEMSKTLSKNDYIRNLDMTLTFNVDCSEHINRISELSNKTNQFIFSYKRYSVAQVEDLIRDKNISVISIQLKDRLSDSGIIGVLVLRKIDDVTANLEECFVSCRALGRGIDDIIILHAVQVAINRLGVDTLKVNLVTGERNLPAIKFAQEYFASYLCDTQPFDFKAPDNLVNIIVLDNNIKQA